MLTNFRKSLNQAILLILPAAVAPLGAQTTTAEGITTLEQFIASESALADSGDLLPTSRPVASVFGEQSVLDSPRAITVLTPELMARFDIQDFGDLGKIGAGTQQLNYYGVPGTPVLRGAVGGVFFNGLQRAYQRNEMPLSFGSFEAMDVVKGPAPAQYGPSQAGGYVNMIPKSPFFDRSRGSLRVTVGSPRWLSSVVSAKESIRSCPTSTQSDVPMRLPTREPSRLRAAALPVASDGTMRRGTALPAFAIFGFTDPKNTSSLPRYAPFAIGAGYISNQVTDDNVWGVSGSFDFAGISIAAMYDHLDSDSGADVDNMALTGQYKFANNILKLGYARTDPDGGNERDEWAVGLQHNLSSSARMWVEYTDEEDEGNLLTIGLRKDW